MIVLSRMLAITENRGNLDAPGTAGSCSMGRSSERSSTEPSDPAEPRADWTPDGAASDELSGVFRTAV
jgi:hypothetical protein